MCFGTLGGSIWIAQGGPALPLFGSNLFQLSDDGRGGTLVTTTFHP